MKMLGSDVCSNLPQITVPKLFLPDGTPHPDGLLSTTIFGDTLKDRSERFASIPFNTELFHPEVWRLLRRVFRDKIKAILNLVPYTIENGEIKILEEKTDNAFIGLSALIDKIFEVKIPDNVYGKKLKAILDKYPDKVRISCILVIPPVYRDVKDEVNLDELNQTYIDLIRFANNIITIPKSYTDEKYNRYINLMQLKIQKIYEYIESKVGKKFGAIRQHLLGKRIDFTGRAVIVPNPEIPLDTLGIPVRMAVKLFEPWLIRQMLQEGYALDQALDLLNRIAKGYIKEGKEYDHVKEILQTVTKDRVVLAKRDPALHRLSWQGFKISLVDGNVIELNPLHSVGFNADHDGDSLMGHIKIEIHRNTRNDITEQSTNNHHSIHHLVTHIKNLEEMYYDTAKNTFIFKT